MDIIKRLSEELNIAENRLNATVELLDAGNTVPFVARYRKEVTGGLDDTVLRNLLDRLTYLRNLEKRKEEVKALIAELNARVEALIGEVVKIAEKINDLFVSIKELADAVMEGTSEAIVNAFNKLRALLGEFAELFYAVKDALSTLPNIVDEINTILEIAK